MPKTRHQTQPLAPGRSRVLPHNAMATGHIHLFSCFFWILLHHLHLLPLDLLPIRRSALPHQLSHFRGNGRIERTSRVAAAKRSVPRRLLPRRRGICKVVQHAIAEGEIPALRRRRHGRKVISQGRHGHIQVAIQHSWRSLCRLCGLCRLCRAWRGH